MELMDSSMDKVSELVYNKLKECIPEDILGKMSVSVSEGEVGMSLYWQCHTLCHTPHVRW